MLRQFYVPLPELISIELLPFFLRFLCSFIYYLGPGYLSTQAATNRLIACMILRRQAGQESLSRFYLNRVKPIAHKLRPQRHARIVIRQQHARQDLLTGQVR